MTGRFDGKVALVTGGSSGIGECVARALAAEGAEVAILASSSLDKAHAVASSIVAAGGNARPYKADVRDAAAMVALMASVEADLGGLDLLVNAAGVFYATPVGATDGGDAARMIDINVTGLWNSIAAATPLMQRRGGGRIVNCASTAAMIGINSHSLYCASKAAVVMMTRALTAELAPMNIAINAVAPGNTATPMNEDVRNNAEAIAAMQAMTPSGVAFSDADAIAGVILFLLSNEARAVHGATWLADEGISAAIG
ncbi:MULTISPECIES: SDR family NAD(P)-dependent oxidoreductase [Blastomonas]|uniref:Short-chain dehydrogenase n=1 Tax=Blastomonas fulva TaxID=1550728 RepID=A0ABN5B9I5_9SPHN|nr:MULTISPECIES: SDR family NAD(P)-dependent oxidoreductase [Blastomonas]AOG01250.1 short chain dehydrogenase family protein [Blastomonas sp. RAC04]ASR53646.1 short-chain dehydrogenase [Blastomonas fulva]